MTDDVVNHPSHYTQYEGIEIIDLTEQMNFNKGNAVKYICRSGFKPVGDLNKEIEDLEKAKFYVTREIQRLTLKLGQWEEARGRKLEELKERVEAGITTSDDIRATIAILDGLKSKNNRIVKLDDNSVTQIKALFANVPSLKMARETLCRAQTNADTPGEKNQIWELIEVIDKLRPLGPDGKHGDRHTPYCGCEDR